ncbi:hypothetical protein [Natrarchaeobius oligotrophus]|uniref:DUF8009 domain-containing protein n=1 Tax=Natrarchaeobius chitinivorans TaxID=1679083 RepID=A0A3N6N1K8_NATCH|nr:hypothetical protein [Natrarchaeobius chitinivorans]RQH01437.1 hypothetical protein EA472_08335 [Natrarchaeobius chitinivorans]
MGGDDPSAIRSLAITAEDAVDAYAYGRENPGTAVLRITPPFHGRMRARLHVCRTDDAAATGAIHVPPGDVIDDDVLEAYPTLEGEFDSGPTDTERVRKRHAEAVGEWRSRAREAIVDRVTLETVDGDHVVEVNRLE